MKLAIQDISAHLGGLLVDSVLAMFLHSNSQHYFQEIGNALDGRRAINKDLSVTSRDVLELLSRHVASAQDIPSSSLLAYSAAPTGRRPYPNREKGAGPSRPVGQPSESMMTKSITWAKANLTWRNPCVYCYDWGHWIGDCPRKEQKLPPLADPRRFYPQTRLKLSPVCHAAFRQGRCGMQVASVEQHPQIQDSALLDSGATDSVTNDTNFP